MNNDKNVVPVSETPEWDSLGMLKYSPEQLAEIKKGHCKTLEVGNLCVELKLIGKKDPVIQVELLRLESLEQPTSSNDEVISLQKEVDKQKKTVGTWQSKATKFEKEVTRLESDLEQHKSAVLHYDEDLTAAQNQLKEVRMLKKELEAKVLEQDEVINGLNALVHANAGSAPKVIVHDPYLTNRPGGDIRGYARVTVGDVTLGSVIVYAAKDNKPSVVEPTRIKASNNKTYPAFTVKGTTKELIATAAIEVITAAEKKAPELNLKTNWDFIREYPFLKAVLINRTTGDFHSAKVRESGKCPGVYIVRLAGFTFITQNPHKQLIMDGKDMGDITVQSKMVNPDYNLNHEIIMVYDDSSESKKPFGHYLDGTFSKGSVQYSKDWYGLKPEQDKDIPPQETTSAPEETSKEGVVA